MARLQLVPDRQNKDYRVVMLSGPMRGGDVAYGRFDKDGHFVYQWDEGLHYDFSKTEAAKLIDKAISNGEQYSEYGTYLYDSELR